MSLTDERATELLIAAAKTEVRDKLLEIGVPEERIAGTWVENLAAGVSVGAIEDRDLEVYRPDPANDLRRVLREQLDSQTPPTLLVIQPLIDGRTERIEMSARETAAYFAEGITVGQREDMRLRRIRERHVRVALDAAQRLVRETGDDVLRQPQPGRQRPLSIDEELCLREYGALTQRRKRVREASGAVGYELVDRLQDNAIRVLERAVAGGMIEPERVREVANWDETSSVSYRPPLSGMTGYMGADGFGVERYDQTGPNTREMMLNDVWDEQAKSRWAYAHDPLVKFAIKAKVAYLLGRGFSVECDDEKVQAVVDDFRKEHSPQWYRKRVTAGHILGEQLLREIKLPAGKTRFANIPPETIWEVVTDAEERSKVLYYVQRYTTRFQLFAPADQGVRYIERIIPAAQIKHWKINDDLDETRGRGEAYASLAWHRRLRDIADAAVEREYVANAYTTFAKIKGTQADVNAFLASMPKGRPRPNTYVAFNEKVEDFNMLDPKGADAGTGSVWEMLIVTAALGYGIPKEYMGISGNRSRGGAVIAEGPIQKLLEERQEDVGGDLVEPTIDTVIENAQAGGALTQGGDVDYRVLFPEIIKGDSQAKIANLTVGRDEEWISSEHAGEIWAGEMDIPEYDFDKEQTMIKAEKAMGIGVPPLPVTQPGSVNPGPGVPGAPAGGARPTGPQRTGSGDRPRRGGTPDATSARGASQIRRSDRNAAREGGVDAGDDMSVEDAAAIVSAAGGVVILP